MEDKSQKVNVTFKPNVLEILDEYADMWGLSRSGMLSALVMMKYEQDKAGRMIEQAGKLQG